MREGEDEIGWMLSESPAKYPEESQYVHPSEDTTVRTDVVYDENDRVIFYNRGEERVFPRSAGIIGREVRFCHPPKSVDTVLKILEEFRKGTQNEASFWFNYRDKLIYVRYFAVRDSEKNYRGVIEMSQDISETKKIEGERRLLEWE